MDSPNEQYLLWLCIKSFLGLRIAKNFIKMRRKGDRINRNGKMKKMSFLLFKTSVIEDMKVLAR